MPQSPDISIALITYNHEKFIADTFRGIAMQKFSGTIEVVIGDDCSADATRELARTFAASHPNVRLLFHASNGGMVFNWVSTIDACKGRYVALCEGDDYWTDPLKLQRQFDLLEKHPEHSMCWHPVDVVEEGVQRPYPYDEGKEVADANDIIGSHFIPTCSLLFRNRRIQPWPIWIKKVMSMDIAVELLLALHGTAVRVDMVMGTYRKHQAGITESGSHQRLGAIRLLYLLKKFNVFSQGEYDRAIRERMQEISVFNLKLQEVRSPTMLLHRLNLFQYHLYAVRATNFREFRHEVYLHLMPETYQRIRILLRK